MTGLATSGALSRRDWLAWAALVGLAALLRLASYSGFFGSDEVTYTASAFKLLDGDWTVERYVGANRYGVNLPVAAIAWLFGRNEWAAAAYSMSASVAEVAILSWFGMRVFGFRAGLLAGLLLACLPNHVHSAGRLLADAPLGLTMTASFALFWYGFKRGSRVAYLLGGLFAGFSFWIKPATIIYLAVLGLVPLLLRRWHKDWLWFIGGCSAMLLANNLLFLALTGEFWYLFDAIRERQASGYLEAGSDAGLIVDSPVFYLNYLFVDVYHTWGLGYLALAGIVIVWRRRRDAGPRIGSDDGFVLIWALGLLGLFSLFVVRLDPLLFIPKQTNYMLMFMAPLCLLGGFGLAALRGRALVTALALVLVPSFALAQLHQASIAAFTANSKAAVEWARVRPTVEVFGGSNAYRAGRFDALVRRDTAPATVRDLATLPSAPVPPPGWRRVAIVDLETARWAVSDTIRRLDDVPGCWRRIGTLAPVGLGWVARALDALATIVGPLPARLQSLVEPAPAVIYEVPLSPCDVGATTRN